MTCTRLRNSLTLVALSLAILPPISAKNFFPCHPSKVNPNNDVLCSRVELPPKICKSCPLRPTDDQGSFVDCQRIYNTESEECHQALQEYIDLNECDHVRKKAFQGLKQGDDEARSVVDYFLYSICEQCCDCVPMGTKRTDYIALATGHKSKDPLLWKEARGNCPAHAQFDVCKVLPNVQYFTKPGGDQIEAPKACPLLRQWQNSPAASEWQINPEAEIRPELQTFLRGMLGAIDCDNFSIWTACHELEEKQNHLEISDEFADKKPKIPTTKPPTTEPPTTDPPTTDPPTTDPPTTDPPTTDPPTTDPPTTEPPTTDPPTTEPPTTGTSATGSTTIEGTTTKSTTTTENDSTNDDDGDDGDDSNDGSSPPSDSQSGGTSDSSPATCFPSTGIVELRSGKMVTMQNLRIGDWVRVSEEEFSQVFLFTHRTANADEKFVQIAVGNSTLQVTDGHLVYANGVAVPAEMVRKGDMMRTRDGVAPVKEVKVVKGRGLYNPQTLHGDIVVDGVVVSTYTRAIEKYTATALLTPIRGLFRQGWIAEESIGGWFREGYRSIMPML